VQEKIFVVLISVVLK